MALRRAGARFFAKQNGASSANQAKRVHKRQTQHWERLLRPPPATTPRSLRWAADPKTNRVLKQSFARLNPSPVQDADVADRVFYDEKTVAWQDLNLDEEVTSRLQEQWPRPARVQVDTASVMLRNRDVVLLGETGCGKTIAFLAPLVHLLRKDKYVKRNDQGPRCVLMAPTRELVAQTYNVLVERFGGLGLRIEAARGRELWPRGADVVLATPNNVANNIHLRPNCMVDCKYIVLDEADVCLSLASSKELKRILKWISGAQSIQKRVRAGERVPGAQRALKHAMETAGWKRPQWVLAGATIASRGTKSVANMVRKQWPHAEWISSPLAHTCFLFTTFLHPRVTTEFAPIKDEEHRLQMLREHFLKYRNKLIEHIRDPAHVPAPAKTLVFASSSKLVEDIHAVLQELGIGRYVGQVSNNCEEADNTLNLARFAQMGDPMATEGIVTVDENGARVSLPPLHVLVSTDVLSRGVDFGGFPPSHVLCADWTDVSTFLHRAGRTARGAPSDMSNEGTRGHVSVLFDEKQREYVELLLEDLDSNGTVEACFSRKRSLRNRVRRRMKRRMQRTVLTKKSAALKSDTAQQKKDDDLQAALMSSMGVSLAELLQCSDEEVDAVVNAVRLENDALAGQLVAHLNDARQETGECTAEDSEERSFDDTDDVSDDEISDDEISDNDSDEEDDAYHPQFLSHFDELDDMDEFEGDDDFGDLEMLLDENGFPIVQLDDSVFADDPDMQD